MTKGPRVVVVVIIIMFSTQTFYRTFKPSDSKTEVRDFYIDLSDLYNELLTTSQIFAVDDLTVKAFDENGKEVYANFNLLSYLDDKPLLKPRVLMSKQWLGTEKDRFSMAGGTDMPYENKLSGEDMLTKNIFTFMGADIMPLVKPATAAFTALCSRREEFLEQALCIECDKEYHTFGYFPKGCNQCPDGALLLPANCNTSRGYKPCVLSQTRDKFKPMETLSAFVNAATWDNVPPVTDAVSLALMRAKGADGVPNIYNREDLLSETFPPVIQSKHAGPVIAIPLTLMSHILDFYNKMYDTVRIMTALVTTHPSTRKPVKPGVKLLVYSPFPYKLLTVTGTVRILHSTDIAKVVDLATPAQRSSEPTNTHLLAFDVVLRSVNLEFKSSSTTLLPLDWLRKLLDCAL